MTSFHTQRPLTVPTFVHRWHEHLISRREPRFSALPSQRAFIGYQVRLLNLLIALVKGQSIGNITTTIAHNPYFIESDFNDLQLLVRDLTKVNLLDAEQSERITALLSDTHAFYKLRPLDFQRSRV